MRDVKSTAKSLVASSAYPLAQPTSSATTPHPPLASAPPPVRSHRSTRPPLKPPRFTPYSNRNNALLGTRQIVPVRKRPPLFSALTRRGDRFHALQRIEGRPDATLPDQQVPCHMPNAPPAFAHVPSFCTANRLACTTQPTPDSSSLKTTLHNHTYSQVILEFSTQRRPSKQHCFYALSICSIPQDATRLLPYICLTFPATLTSCLCTRTQHCGSVALW